MTISAPPLGRNIRRLRIVLYSGIAVRHDAISGSLRVKLALLERWRDHGLPIEVVGFVQHTDVALPSVVVAPTVAQLVAHPAFCAADMHLFEFGIHYDLFDAVFLVPRPARRLAVYHNITPLHLVEEPPARRAVERALRQKANLTRMDHVACDSELNRVDLVAFGLAPERLSVLHLPVAAPDPRTEAVRGGPGRSVELLYLGRFVRAKGVLDLLEAARSLSRSGVGAFRLTLAGSQTFSDPAVVAEVVAASSDPSGIIRFVGEPADAEVRELMAGSDVLVMPSYHEGYCLPVIEAYAQGCQVTAYDAGNLPNVVGGLGQLVPTGDTGALAKALATQIDAISDIGNGGAHMVPTTAGWWPVDTWRAQVADHLAQYSAHAYEAAFRALLVTQARAIPGVAPKLVDALANG